MSREGTVRFQGYKTGGEYTKPGLRNRRRAHWAKIRQAEMIEKERRAEQRAMLNSSDHHDYENMAEEWYGRPDRPDRPDRDNRFGSDRFGSDRFGV